MLLAGIASGTPGLAMAFVRRFQSHVFGVALAVVGDPVLAEDIAQQAFERVLRRSSSFDPAKGSVSTWLSTIARNLAIDSVRARRPDPVDPLDLISLLGPAADEPEPAMLRNESKMQLRAALRQLPADQARALVMAGVYGLTALEVASAENIPLGTAKTRIRAGMVKLRSSMADVRRMEQE